MALQFTQRKAEDVPSASGAGKVNPELGILIYEMKQLEPGMVLEIETGGDRGVRSTKTLISKAAKVLDMRWRHWDDGNKVFAQPAEPTKRRGQPKSA